jgi:glycosyltransferase involved in cell wall biosynthesis
VHLIALVQSPDHVCCRYRLSAFRASLESAGHRLELRPYPRRAWGWFALARELPATCTIILQRKLLTRWQVYLLRRGSRRLIFDYDDAVFLRDSYSPRGLEDPVRLRAFARTVRAADGIAAGNAYLLEEARSVGAPGRGTVIPTCVDVKQYALAEHTRAGEGVELVWIGSSSTLQGLERIRPLLESLGQRYHGLRLKLVCDRFLHLEHLPVLARRWSEAGEAAELASADIGIAWVPDDRWSRGKCGLKVLQYLAAGLPVVGNAVGVQAAMIRHGETGFIAETPEQWADAIGRLAHDPALRRRMGQAGRRLVEQEYSLPAGASRWLALLRSMENAERRAA